MKIDPWTPNRRLGWPQTPSSSEEDGPMVGYEVVALNGPAGAVAELSLEPEASYAVIDTWMTGHRRVIPAGAIDFIDHQLEQVLLAMTKAEIMRAPAFRGELDAELEDAVAEYFRPWCGRPAP